MSEAGELQSGARLAISRLGCYFYTSLGSRPLLRSATCAGVDAGASLAFDPE
jgi:hypothetical protein